jgi:putative ABC transport system substrate-binding protein
MSGRRAALAAIAASLGGAWPLWARAALSPKIQRIGVLCSGEKVPYFWEQLRALGYEEHRNVDYVFKDIDVEPDLAGHAARLAAANVDVIVACSNNDASAATKAAPRIPVVLLYGVAPVEVGLVASLARPGGNLTGSAAITSELAAKSVEVFRNAVPALRSVALVVDLESPIGRALHPAKERAARNLGLAASTWSVPDAAALSRAFLGLARNRPDGMVLDISAIDRIPEIIEFAARERLPAMYPVAPAVRQGALMAYSPNWIPQSKRNAQMVDRILKGTKPRDIPVEQPVSYAFSINLRTARALGLTIPPAVMLQATSVIE